MNTYAKRGRDGEDWHFELRLNLHSTGLEHFNPLVYHPRSWHISHWVYSSLVIFNTQFICAVHSSFLTYKIRVPLRQHKISSLTRSLSRAGTLPRNHPTLILRQSALYIPTPPTDRSCSRAGRLLTHRPRALFTLVLHHASRQSHSRRPSRPVLMDSCNSIGGEGKSHSRLLISAIGRIAQLSSAHHPVIWAPDHFDDRLSQTHIPDPHLGFMYATPSCTLDTSTLR